jgi:GTP-binding protein Era
MQDIVHHFGYVTIVGRPNVGKSTILNHIIGQKLSITSRKPQTTRMRILGIKSGADSQIIYIDTPGFQNKPGGIFNRYMNREVLNSMADVDVIVHVVEAMSWTKPDECINALVNQYESDSVLAVNKIDRIKNKIELLPFIEKMHAMGKYKEIIPVSARTNKNINLLEGCIRRLLPPGEPLYPQDQITDRSERYFAAEFIREKLTRCLGDELPYNLCVTVDKFMDTGKLIRINASIWVNNSGQKKIVVGKDGGVLKKTGEQARRDMERMFSKKVFLETWVRIKRNWTTDIQALKRFGYDG